MANLTSDQRARGSQGQGQFNVSSLGWLCVFHRGQWVPVFKLTDEQLVEFSTWKELGLK